MEGARSVQERERYEADDALALAPEQAVKRIKKLEAEMMKLARNLEFEQAARMRDQFRSSVMQPLACPNANRLRQARDL